MWLMMLLTFIELPRDSFLSDTLSLDLMHQYYLEPQNVSLYPFATQPLPAYCPTYCRFLCEG